MQLNLSPLLSLIEQVPAYRELVAALNKTGKVESGVIITDSAKPYLIASLYEKLQLPLLVVTAQPENAKKLYEQISVWSDSRGLNLFPEPDILPYQRTIADFSIEQERLQVLFALSSQETPKKPLIVCSVPALIHKTIARDEFVSACHTVKTGLDIDPLSLLGRWESLGYRVETSVEVPGTISRRGDIVDIFPPTSDLPVRLEFFGNTIESIRFYEPSSQRSQKVVSQITITPATEILLSNKPAEIKSGLDNLDLSGCSQEIKEQFDQEILMLSSGQRPPNISFYASIFSSGSLLDYLPADALVVLDEPSQLKEEVKYLDDQANDLREQKVFAGELPPNFPVPYFRWEELQSGLGKAKGMDLTSWSGPSESGDYRLNFTQAPSYIGQLPMLIQKSQDFLDQKRRLIFISNQASRLSELLDEANICAQPLTEITNTPQPGSLTLVQGSLAEGWGMGDTYLLTDKEIFGFVKERRLVKKRPVRRYKLLVDIKPGDYVVHVEHGIGQFEGVTNMSTDSTQREYLILKYASGDKLYVPTDQIDRVNRYVGTGEQVPVLSRLGTQEWTRTKQKVKEAVEEIAQDLLKLYAARQVVSGFTFSPDTVWQRELEASFPYVETPDQIKVQEEVKADMSRDKPMDRLVVGDVGYGKTEIAIRAAFKAVMDNKQVAVLVPTTVLAEQHYITFKQRMGIFPLKIDVLSRFRSHREQKAVIDGLADGSIDICIGTHRILQKDVKFKDLGLLIIDEEQRFGVSHKEFLKKLREQVDVLTLSATPIPRTLHMSLVGVRDMSVIDTPPENRLPIRTYVAEYNDQLVREAIIRELERNGQVFFVHNRVQGIAGIANKLKALVPEASIDIAHGQMPEENLEQVMFKFQKGETNILVCTTIIESGLDLPNVNTLIVNRADRFGLTQLYQLRGRIGRGSNLAYAYFLYEKEQRLTHAAEKRLRTIFEATELGAGFGIAMKDLEIRGAGTLLGNKQSGNISAVGFSLYTQLLSQAVEEQKAKMSGAVKGPQPVRLPAPTIDLPLRAYLPDDYISDIDTRLSIYQKLTDINSVEQVEDLAKELKDRFGDIPEETQNLLFVLKLKALGSKAMIESISTSDNIINIHLFPGMQFNRTKLTPVMLKYGVKIGITQLIINLKRLGKDWHKGLEEIILASI
jgi:transcription-repair coupling factor (superfamily II helicase)